MYLFSKNLWTLMTRQKVELNAIVSSRLYKEPDWNQALNMDNCYKAPSLFAMFKTQYKILAC